MFAYRIIPLVVFLVLVLAGCRDDPYQPADPADPEPIPPGEFEPQGPAPGSMPPIDGGAVIDSVTVEQPFDRQPGEVARLAPNRVVAISVDSPDFSYSIERLPEPRVVRGPESERPTAAAIDALLARYAPLEGQDVLSGLRADDVRARPTHRIIFHMEDESALEVAFVRRGEFAAAASQAGAPVYRLAAERLRDLVPPLERLR